jgi:hypothetical protein
VPEYVTRPPESAAATATLFELGRVEKVYRCSKLEYPARRGVDLSALRGVDLSISAGEGSRSLVRPAAASRRSSTSLPGSIVRPLGLHCGHGAGRSAQRRAAGLLAGVRTSGSCSGFHLLPTLSALENAVLPLEFLHCDSKRERFDRPRHSLNLVESMAR